MFSARCRILANSHVSPAAKSKPISLQPFLYWYLRRRIRNISNFATLPNGYAETLLIDTSAVVRKLESQGYDAKEVEAVTAAMTDMLNNSLQIVSDSIVTKSDLHKYNLMQEAAFEKLQTELQESQEKKLSTIQRDTEKLRVEIDKLQSTIRYEMEKVTAGQRLDLNLERGRIKEELANQTTKTSELTNKLDKEINALKSELEASKYEVIKYCIGTIVSVYALGLALLQIFK